MVITAVPTIGPQNVPTPPTINMDSREISSPKLNKVGETTPM